MPKHKTIEVIIGNPIPKELREIMGNMSRDTLKDLAAEHNISIHYVNHIRNRERSVTRTVVPFLSALVEKASEHFSDLNSTAKLIEFVPAEG